MGKGSAHPLFKKGPKTPEEIDTLLSLYRRLRKQGEDNSNLTIAKKRFNTQPWPRGRELFQGHSPEVKERAKEILKGLMEKHKVKIAEKWAIGYRQGGGYVGLLIGTAVRMAREELGLSMSPQEKGRRARGKNRMYRRLRKEMGLTQLTPTPLPSTELTTSQTNMEGI